MARPAVNAVVIFPVFIACALSAGAKFIISADQDLLKLGKPFGIEVIPPSQFIARHKL